MKAPYFLLLFFFFVTNLFGQSDNERYSTVGINYEDYQRLVTDNNHGLAIDHFHKNEKQLLEFIFSESELEQLVNRGINYEVIIEDYKNHFLQLVNQEAGTRTLGCGLNNFDDGEMGGYHTFDQMVVHINSMQTQFPGLVNIVEIGQTIESRPIYAVKISDEVMLDESLAEGVVYFEAITHAREPMSLEATLYYMWWLLENYDSDPEATFLVNNREIYFVPIVNPDGYVYNQQTDPNGGGLWRKNRRDAGNGCFGVDLNRNYPKGWGLDSGSSNDPCTQTYRGAAPFSEPESEAISNFLTSINPAIAFSSHTYGDKFLSPWGYVDSLATYEMYAEFVSEFIPTTYDGYGTTAKMLNYTSSGTTRDYIHTTGTFAWTPEIGHSFWEPPSVICDRVMEFLKPMKYLTWVSGNYVGFHDFTLINDRVWIGDTIAMDIRLKNKGLTKVAEDVLVTLSTGHPSFSAINTDVNYADINARDYSESLNAPFQHEVIGDLILGEQIPFTLNVYHNGALSYSKVIYITAGQQTILNQTDFETDNPWLLPALDWDTTFMDAVSGFHSFADSRFGNYLANSNTMVIMDQVVDLTNATLPIATFHAKWSLEPNFDYASLLVSTTGNSDWLPLPGWHTDVFNNYNENSYWVQEFIDLSDYIGEPEVYFAYQLQSDNGVHSDGIYIDDFIVSDYTVPIMVTNENLSMPFSGWKVVPNPNAGLFQLNIQMKESMEVTIVIYDVLGNVLLQKQTNLNKGTNWVSLQSDLWSKGLYSVQLQMNGGQKQLKMVVVE